MPPIQMILSQKQKHFSDAFATVWKSTQNFEHFLIKDNPHS